MKAFDLKSMSWLMALAMMFALSFTSCSDDDENDAIVPIFPELKEINCGANETVNISFEANLDWELSSNASWCKFVNGEFSETSMQGKAGSQTISITASADGQNYNDDAIAEITLTMNKQSQVIYKVKRAKKEYADLIVSDENGNIYDKDHPLTIKASNISGSEVTVIKAQAEEGMKIGFTNPEWLDYNINTETGEYEFSFKMDNESGISPKYPIAQGEYTLTFMTEDAETATTDKIRKVEIPLIYEGMKADAININPAHGNVTFTAEGNITNSEITGSQLVSTITTLNDDYEIVEFIQSKDNETGEYVFDFSGNGEVDWIETSYDKDNVTLSVQSNEDENATERSGIVMIFPKAVYEEIKNDLENNIIDKVGTEGNPATNDIKSRYNANVMAYIEQEAPIKRISFIAETVYMGMEPYTYIEGMGLGIPTVEFTDLKDSPNVEEYDVVNNNVWKAVVHKEFASMLSEVSAELIFEAVGITDNQKITENNSNINITSNERIGNVEASSGLPTRIVNGLGVTFNNVNTYDNQYQLVVKNESNEIIALCIITIE